MEAQATRAIAPSSVEELAEELRAADDAGQTVRVRGAATKLAWAAAADPAVEISTTGLDGRLEHNPGDLTAVLSAGVPLARAQEVFAQEDQMLALDPPGAEATIGGVVAAADSGPLRARYGGVRDLVIGVRVALADGTLAKSGGQVIKNVAGYDLAKLFAGSFGTLGAITEVSVRLHPIAPETVTALGHADDPAVLARGAHALSHARLEQLGLDVRWSAGRGSVLSRSGGATAQAQAEAAQPLLDEAGLDTEIREDDDGLWQAQRERQRSPGGLVAKVSALQADLPDLLDSAERHGATLVGRYALGLFWLRLDDGSPGELVSELRGRYVTAVLDRPEGLELERDAGLDRGVELLMRRVKQRFDPKDTLV
ncbi:MAG TPA: FAD-binding oxidoreductase [Thermoleophilaceae bacterium]|nr:FAD-binding oxidoreductase [Thermoleophilaceae bacterium]